MEFELWHIWVITALICIIMEIFIPSFVLFNFGIGALLGSLAAGVNLSPEWQVVFFSAGTIISFFLIRPAMKKFAYSRSHNIATNADAMIGKKAKVVEPIDNLNNQGRVILDGDTWQARSENNETISGSTPVVVVSVKSIILIVKPL